MKKTYLETLIDVQPLLRYLEVKYLGRFKVFNLVFMVVHDSTKERDLFIEDLCTTDSLKIFEWHRVGELMDVVYSKYMQ
jgi:hypothetical protein